MVTNPGNPTGVVLTDDEMKMLVDLAKKHDLFLIGDEAYREFIYGGLDLLALGVVIALLGAGRDGGDGRAAGAYHGVVVGVASSSSPCSSTLPPPVSPS